MQENIGGHDKRKYRVDRDGKVSYAINGGEELKPASMHQRTAMGKHKDGSIYLRATDAEDLGAIKAAADTMGINYRQRRSGAMHHGFRGSFEHLHFDKPVDALKVHAVMAYQPEKDADCQEQMERLERGLRSHVLGRDRASDAAMQATSASLNRSKGALASDMPDAHFNARDLHAVARESHQAQAARPWAGNEAVLHAGLAVLHHRLAQHHDEAGAKATVRIEAERRRKAEMKKRMEELQEGREAKKGLESMGAGTDLSKLSGGGALRAENHDEELADATMGREVEKSIELEQLPTPTKAQRRAGNYEMHHLNVQGLDISIENPVGSTRSGTAKDGTEWKTTMTHHYGYLKRTEGADGDHVDCFVGPNPEDPYVHVINQIEPTTGKFDEHKCMIGFKSREAAIKGYHNNYQDGWKGLDSTRTMHMDDFKDWLKNGDTKSRLVYKAAGNRLHGIAVKFIQASRLRPAMKSVDFVNAVFSARSAGLPESEIFKLISIAAGGDPSTAKRVLSTVPTN